MHRRAEKRTVAVATLFGLGLLFAFPLALRADTLKVTILDTVGFGTYSVSDATAGFQSVFTNQADGSNPFPAGFTYSTSGSANVPGTAAQGNLTTTTISFSNTSGSAQTIKVTFDAFTFSLPDGPSFSIDTSLSTNFIGSASVTGTMEALIGATSLDSFAIGAAGTSSVKTMTVAGSATYTLRSIFTVTIPDGISSPTNLSITTAVNVPEPWNLISVIATMVPVGLLYLGLRRRKPKAASNSQ